MAEKANETRNPAVVALDRKLAAVFKALLKGPVDGPNGVKVRKEFRALRERVLDEGFGKELDSLIEEFSPPPDQREKPGPAEALGRVRYLRDRGFVDTSSLLFSEWREILGGLHFVSGEMKMH